MSQRVHAFQVIIGLASAWWSFMLKITCDEAIVSQDCGEKIVQYKDQVPGLFTGIAERLGSEEPKSHLLSFDQQYKLFIYLYLSEKTEYYKGNFQSAPVTNT